MVGRAGSGRSLTVMSGSHQEAMMKISRLVSGGIVTLSAMAWAGTAAADAAAGRAKFDAVCAECHEAADFEGEDAAALSASLKKIVGGQMKHKQALKLSDAEIADLAAYMSAGK
jgi:mono/diheme cytochrome c family protein